ncbi:sensor histidine kinase [Nocardioides sp. QY071]|uniref:sensor histidine kinase n=1 Tax=Nocardioides sp. QY071 TaxID=3044187 RepID=UPI00249BA6F4|nr:sensor histidine kinase [Nocardioides sp. QY071]WGY00485.1 sensor histidine kinase [Nocardioides sp. QY071]
MLARPCRDGAIAAAAFATCLLGGALQVDDTVAAPPAMAYAVAAISSALTLARHRAPVATLAATTVCGMLVAPLGLLLTPLTVAPAVISAYSLAVRAERRSAIAVLLPCAALLVVLAPFVEDDVSWEDASRLVTVAAAPLVAAVLGRLTRHRRAHLAFMEERAVRAEEAQHSEARRKVAEERVRIARELHDLVAHQITLANAQANVAAHLIDTHPAQARASLDELVRTTRQALDELRATVGLLRQRDDAAAPAQPAPGLDRLPQLVESFRRAGLRLSVREDGVAVPPSPAVDLTAYRIIQEALTNVTKHAAAGRADILLTWSRETVTITVTNDGLGSSTPPEHPAGYGLIGMRERASAVGGHLTAGVQPDGGFHVVAHLPLPSAGGTPEGPAASEDR